MDLGVAPEILEDEDADLTTVDIEDYTAVEYDYDEMKRQLRHSCLAGALGLLIRIKFFLKDQYVLDNEKCQTYRPDKSSKVRLQLHYDWISADTFDLIVHGSSGSRCRQEAAAGAALRCHAACRAPVGAELEPFPLHVASCSGGSAATRL